MNRATIDFGIDLGTTNSAVAVLKGVSTEIIKNNRDADITPSTVYIDKKGVLHTGERAKARMIDHPSDGFLEFKRRMGTESEYVFRASGQKWKPEQLSAEILKSLRADVQQRCGEDIDAAVITVPAAFELHQCDATRKAAQLAGFTKSPLLQEPVAAALAYGFQADAEKAYWMVYDFGGGTFDAALIKSEDGSINVVNHGGDNFLGGSDIDWSVIEKLVLPRIMADFSLVDFNRANSGEGQRWRQAFARIKSATEQAKIDLSRKPVAVLELTNVVDEQTGKTVISEFECELSRQDLIEVAQPIIERSIAICHNVLAEKSLSARAVHKLILVGGPTLAPYFRDLLRDGLGIPIDHTVDPLTVVARGAAVFAGTQKVDAKATKSASAGEYSIDLKYKAVGNEIDPIVGGRIATADGADISGFTIELVNTRTQWRSGRIALPADATFMANLHAERGERNTFAIELVAPNGVKQKTIPDHFTYTVGAVVEEQPLIHSMGVAFADDSVEWFFHKGSGLPLKKKARDPFRTVKAITRSESEIALVIPVVEGGNEVAERNRLVGTLNIPSSRIKRDLPAGSEVEVTLKMSESRIITIAAYVPILDEDFEEHFDLRKKATVVADLELQCKTEFLRLQALKADADRASDNQSLARAKGVEESELIKEVKESLAASKGDPDAAEKCEKRLLELKLELDGLEGAIQLPRMVAEANTLLDELDELVKEHGSDEQRTKAALLRTECDDIISAKQGSRLSRKLKLLQDLYYEVLFSIPAFWVNQFQRLVKESGSIADQTKAERLFAMGRNYLTQNNVQGLRNIVSQLWDLMPREVVEAAKKGFQSGLIK